MKRFAYLVLTVSVNSLVVLGQGGQGDKGDKPRFSIGLGVLAPSYSQKFGGNGRLDFDQDKNGFSYSLNNPHATVSHSSGASSSAFQSQSNPQTYGSAPAYGSGSDYRSPQSSPQGSFNIYQHQSNPRQSANTFQNSPSEDDDYSPPERSAPSQPSTGSQLDHSANIDRQYNAPSVGSGTEKYDDGSYRESEYGGGEYKDDSSDYGGNDGQRGAHEPQGQQQGQAAQPGQAGQQQFGAFNFEQQIAHQIQEAFQNSPQQQSGPNYQSEPSQTYQSQPSHSPAYQSQPSHQRVIRLDVKPIQSQRQMQYRPQSGYALRV